jgi:multidrug efflux pump subunit AcrA (membrane-fusion protein)
LAQAQAQVDQAQATLAERTETLGQTVVRAPITGRVGQRSAEVGMQVGPQSPLFIIGSLDKVRVEVPVTQEMLGRLRVGQRVEIRAESLPDTVISAEVSRISPFLREGSFSAEAEIDVPNEDGMMIAGMFVTADIYYGGSEKATLVPESALYENPDTGEEGVFIVEGSIADSAATPGRSAAPTETGKTGNGVGAMSGPMPLRFRAVEVIAEGDQVSGISGVKEGDWVVVVGQHLLPGRPGEKPMARVRTVTWERVVDLQTLQRHDLLRQFMEKQQRLARRRSDSLSGSRLPAPGGRKGTVE